MTPIPLTAVRRLAVLLAVVLRARLVAYEDAGHGFMFQKRIDFLRRMDRFLG